MRSLFQLGIVEERDVVGHNLKGLLEFDYVKIWLCIPLKYGLPFYLAKLAKYNTIVSLLVYKDKTSTLGGLVF